MITAIEEVLRRSMGLEASSIGAATLEMAIRARMAQVGAATPEDYLGRLRETPAELGELIEAVVIPESWFFRDGTPFAALTRWVQADWQPAHPGETLRVLTIPCSTGEEPYTVAMALLGAGLPTDRFTVDAVDISHRAVERAKRAVYGQNSFRGPTLDFRHQYFTPTPEGYLLAPEVRRQVRFETGNVLAADFRPGAGRFDVIFCRNLLIYFDRPTQTRVVKALSAMLAPDGLLFVGHAETSIPATAGFTATRYPMSFAFRKAIAATPPPVPTPRAPSRPPPQPRVTFRMSGAFPRRTVRIPSASIQAAATSKPGGLDAARALADQGKLKEAGRLCEEHLQQHSASAAAWYLLGTIRDAAGDRPRAAECYVKTLYLEPDHQEALLQRALLADQNGDAAAAAQLRRRIARVQQRSAPP
jgi:chemotaxis protein methyltransferase WspC